MANSRTDATSIHGRDQQSNGAQPSHPRSRRVYVTGTAPGVRVPMREVSLTLSVVTW